MQVGEFGWCVCRWSEFIFEGFEFYDYEHNRFFGVLVKNSATDKETAEAKLRELKGGL